MDHKEYNEVLDKGMAIATEHFAENELYMCKGRRLEFENFSSFLGVCIKSARADLERTKDAAGVLETLLTQMEFMKEDYDKKLASAAKLISKSVTESKWNGEPSA